jgi:hypothetical protein
MSPVRRVRRIIRKIDPWTVLKVSLVFNALLGLAFVLGSVVFWSVFVNAGIPEKISELAEALTLSFNPDGPTYFRIVLLLGVIWTVLATGFATLAALLYNLISDIVGGIEVVVLEETLAAPAQQVQQRRQRRRLIPRRQSVPPAPQQPVHRAEPVPVRPARPAATGPQAPVPPAQPVRSPDTAETERLRSSG